MPGRRWIPLVVAAAIVAGGVAVAAARDRPVERTTITSDSMAPTLPVGTTVRIDRSGADHLARGDIVVFDDPGPWRAAARTRDRPDRAEDHIAKRVIAVGGDDLSCCAPDGRLVLDGEPLDEPYLPPGAPASGLAFEAHVPAGHLWLMGDNRDTSVDSRHLRLAPGAAFVPVGAVLGTVEP